MMQHTLMGNKLIILHSGQLNRNTIFLVVLACEHEQGGGKSSMPTWAQAKKSSQQFLETSLSLGATVQAVLSCHLNNNACQKTIIYDLGSNSTCKLLGPERCCLGSE